MWQRGSSEIPIQILTTITFSKKRRPAPIDSEHSVSALVCTNQDCIHIRSLKLNRAKFLSWLDPKNYSSKKSVILVS